MESKKIVCEKYKSENEKQNLMDMKFKNKMTKGRKKIKICLLDKDEK